MYGCMDLCMRLCTYERYMYVCMYISMYVRKYVCMYERKHACVYIYICG